MSALRLITIVKPYLEARGKKGTYIDIGANKGLTTKPMIGFFNEIHCFEPNPLAIEIMQENIDITKINIHQIALSNYIGNTELVVPNENTEHGSIVQERYKKWQRNRRLSLEKYNVEVATLDSYNFSNVDFIKIDTEQSENQVVEGALETISRDLPVIWMENKRSEAREAVKMLQSLGYNFKTHKADMMFTKEIK